MDARSCSSKKRGHWISAHKADYTIFADEKVGFCGKGDARRQS